jgi:serine/threonine protein kinase
MGRVLLGAGPDGRLVAVKQVHDRYAADDGFRARFRREVGASRRVSGAYTAAVMDADVEAVTPWLASVFVVGPSLGAAVEAAGALPADAVHRLAVGLATALVEIHRTGLIHRDLKPENVLLAEDGVRVIDFGIARAAEEEAELTHTGGVIGSPAYMSPEQAEGRMLTPASDVFSLGSVLALALTGRSPSPGPPPCRRSTTSCTASRTSRPSPPSPDRSWRPAWPRTPPPAPPRRGCSNSSARSPRPGGSGRRRCTR